MSQTSWKVVRVPAELHARIEALAAELMEAHVAGRSCLPNELCERVPLHHVIDRALTEFEERRERSRRPARRSSKGDGRTASLSLAIDPCEGS